MYRQAYCYANMYNYDVSVDGKIDLDSKESLVYIKLFPFVQITLIVLGGLMKGLWELYNSQLSSQISLIVDGVEEATAELFAGLGIIYKNMHAEVEQNQISLRLNKIAKRRKSKKAKENEESNEQESESKQQRESKVSYK